MEQRWETVRDEKGRKRLRGKRLKLNKWGGDKRVFAKNTFRGSDNVNASEKIITRPRSVNEF